MSYLMIENRGEAPVEGFTILGVTTTRFDSTVNTIGQFGSGAKYAINLLMRMAMFPIVFCGKVRLAFASRTQAINDGLFSRDYQRAVVRISSGAGRPTENDLGFMLEHGTQDWDSIEMALREFTANAIDRTLRNGDNVPDDIAIVKVTTPTSREGYTRVFIPWSLEIATWLNNISHYFLHFSKHNWKDSGVIRKNSPDAARYYKQGVLVRSDAESNSLFDYNFKDIRLDESRNADSYSCWSQAGRTLGIAGELVARKTLHAIFNGVCCTEARFYAAHLGMLTDNDHYQHWKNAFFHICGANAALYVTPGVDGHLSNKGFKPVLLENQEWYRFLVECGVPAAEQILSDEERNVPNAKDATALQTAMLNRVWNDLQALDLLNGARKPSLKQFSPVMDENSVQQFGLYKGGTVYVHSTLDGQILYKVMLEELTHHITRAGDLSRAIQDYLFTAIAKLMF